MKTLQPLVIAILLILCLSCIEESDMQCNKYFLSKVSSQISPSTYEYVYNQQELLSKIYEVKNGHKILSFSYEYDNNGRLIAVLGENLRFIIHYNADEQIAYALRYLHPSSIFFDDSLTFEYDASNRIIKQSWYGLDFHKEGVDINSLRRYTTFQYFSENNIRQELYTTNSVIFPEFDLAATRS